MVTHMQTSMQTRTKPGHCGCSDGHGDCCELVCPTRPNFYCGQVLTDEDLKALVDWTTARTSLQRYRDGWGVACGLEATCDHENPSRVIVEAGYGIDCCGRDVVVCDPIHYDFKCDKPFDPCCPGGENPPPPAALAEITLGCIPGTELRAFDLCLRFEEELGGGQRPLSRGNCRSVDDCKYTRVKETGQLCAKLVADPYTPPQHVLERKYRDELTALLNELDKYKTDLAELREWVLKRRLYSFCFVEDCLCEATEQTPAQMIQWIFYIVQDWRNHYFQCLCTSCEPNDGNDGIPLARVWVRSKDESDCRICKVVQVDSYPPYRRLLRRDCRPSHPGCIDLSRYVWREYAEVVDELRQVGFIIGEKNQFPVAEILTVLKANERDVICAAGGARLNVTTYTDFRNRELVVTFQGA